MSAWWIKYFDDGLLHWNLNILLESIPLFINKTKCNNIIWNKHFTRWRRNSVSRCSDPPRCAPGFERQEIVVARQSTVDLRCEVEADPEDGMKFAWTYNNTLGDVFSMPTPSNQKGGLSSVFKYTPKADADFGTLACWASTDIGRQKSPCIFNVLPASKFNIFTLSDNISNEWYS